MAMRRIVATLVLFLAASIAMAEVKTVVLKNGERVTGEVTKTPEGYRVETKMGAKTYPNDQVASVEAVSSTADEYAELVKKTNAKTADDHYKLAEWAFSHNLFDAAQKELAAALALEPEHVKAKLLQKQVEAKLAGPGKTPAATAAASPAPGATNAPSPTEAATAGGIKPEYLVSEEDISHIRMEELRPSDKVTIKFKSGVLEQYIKDRSGANDNNFKDKSDVERFKGKSPMEQLTIILNTPVLNIDSLNVYKDKIEITTDPNFMKDFRASVWPVVRDSCAQAQCHGGNDVNGGFKLFRAAAMTPAIDYTNFVILDGFVSGGRRMINRSSPDQSLLLNYALPNDFARYKHPKKITTPLTSKEDSKYKAIVGWVKSLQAVHPPYRLKYRAPFGMRLTETDIGDIGGSTTEPAASPAPSASPAATPAATAAPETPAVAPAPAE